MHFPQIHNLSVRVYRQSWLQRPASMMWVLVLLCFPHLGHARGRTDETPTTPRDSKWIQRIVDDFRTQLGVPQKVDVQIVDKNPLLVSVAPVDDHVSAFTLSVEEEFLNGLTEVEVRAVIAHELGHVWIFTHHPFLQTEGLANEIARRLVARDNLVQVYEKLWQRQGTTGDLARLVGD
jgi:peptidase M48-like protein